MRIALSLSALMLASASALAAPAGYPQRGRDLAAACAACHGTDGRRDEHIAPLAGRDAGEIVRQLRAFRDGSTPSTVMQQLAKGYSDDDVAAIAQFLAAQPR